MDCRYCGFEIDDPTKSRDGMHEDCYFMICLVKIHKSRLENKENNV